MRVFAYGRDDESAAEATELLSSVASLAIKVKYIFTSISLLEFNSVDLELI